ncbi:MAG: Gfo/Idh/MocA family oxidoreductase [Isosphaeraceae bacterium]
MTDRPLSTNPTDETSSTASRRDFLKGTTVAAAATLSTGLAAPLVHAAGSDTIKVGLIGCGGRGSGAAEQALTADSNAKLVAMAEAFQDRLDDSLSSLKGSSLGSRVDVPKDRQYTGFDAYKHVIDQVDLVLLTTPPQFRPIHLSYAVEKGVHAFVEKPMAVDGPGLRKFIEACKVAKQKNLSLVNGFCWRYDGPRRETMQHVFDGKIGDVVAIETTYNSQGVWEPRKTREECASDMEYQMRNWYYYCWLSGDHIVEQAVHGIDTMGWVTGDKQPIRCWGVGGRQSRTDAKYGNIWDHFSVVYEYPNNVRGYHHCRHWVNTPNQTKDYILGSKGMADVFGNAITGPDKWRYRSTKKKADMYQVEHNEMFAALRAGKPINNGEHAANSTLLALMGRTAAYTGLVVTPDMVLNSKEDLSPPKYEFGPLITPGVPVPGYTKFA